MQELRPPNARRNDDVTAGEFQVHPISSSLSAASLFRLKVLDNVRAIEEGVDADVPHSSIAS